MNKTYDFVYFDKEMDQEILIEQDQPAENKRLTEYGKQLFRNKEKEQDPPAVGYPRNPLGLGSSGSGRAFRREK